MTWLVNATKAAGVPKTSIIQVLKNQMGEFEPARDYRVVHASDCTSPTYCPRRWAFYDMTGTEPKGQWVGTALRATYDLGHEVARVVTEVWGRDVAVGNWKCTTCGVQRTMVKRPADGCAKSVGGPMCNWKYREPQFESVYHGISGSLDVLFDLGATKWAITELKTYAADEFDKMIAPLPEHRTRTRLYMKLVAESDSPYKHQINTHQARILYVSRGFGKMNKDHNEILPFREFVVERDDSSEDLQLALKKGRQIKVYRETKAMPSGICAGPLDKIAKACKFCAECFSGKHPSAQEPL